MNKIILITLTAILLSGCALKEQAINLFKEKEKTTITENEFNIEYNLNKQNKKDLKVIILTNNTKQVININKIDLDQFLKEDKQKTIHIKENNSEALFDFLTEFEKQIEKNLDKEVYIYVFSNSFAHQLAYFNYLKNHSLNRNLHVKTVIL